MSKLQSRFANRTRLFVESLEERRVLSADFFSALGTVPLLDVAQATVQPPEQIEILPPIVQNLAGSAVQLELEAELAGLQLEAQASVVVLSSAGSIDEPVLVDIGVGIDVGEIPVDTNAEIELGSDPVILVSPPTVENVLSPIPTGAPVSEAPILPGSFFAQTTAPNFAISGINGSAIATPGALPDLSSGFILLEGDSLSGGRAVEDVLTEDVASEDEADLLAAGLFDEALFELGRDALEMEEGIQEEIAETYGAEVLVLFQQGPESPMASEMAAPIGAGMFASAAPFDFAALEQAMELMLQDMGELASTFGEWLIQLGPLPWIVMGMAVAVSSRSLIQQRWKKLQRRLADRRTDPTSLVWFPALPELEVGA